MFGEMIFYPLGFYLFFKMYVISKIGPVSFYLIMDVVPSVILIFQYLHFSVFHLDTLLFVKYICLDTTRVPTIIFNLIYNKMKTKHKQLTSVCEL